MIISNVAKYSRKLNSNLIKHHENQNHKLDIKRKILLGEKVGNCAECRFELFDVPGQISELRDLIERRHEIQMTQHSDLSKLVTEVVALQRVQSKVVEVSETRLRMVENELMKTQGASEERRENAVGKHKAGEENGPKFWQEKWFVYIAITFCVLLIMLAGAAIGQNLLSQYLDVLKGVN